MGLVVKFLDVVQLNIQIVNVHLIDTVFLHSRAWVLLPLVLLQKVFLDPSVLFSIFNHLSIAREHLKIKPECFLTNKGDYIINLVFCVLITTGSVIEVKIKTFTSNSVKYALHRLHFSLHESTMEQRALSLIDRRRICAVSITKENFVCLLPTACQCIRLYLP